MNSHDGAFKSKSRGTTFSTHFFKSEVSKRTGHLYKKLQLKEDGPVITDYVKVLT